VLIWAERRVVARMQHRVGPNRVGPFGSLQTLVDGAKMFFKEDLDPGDGQQPGLHDRAARSGSSPGSCRSRSSRSVGR
jgi:NADH:ubiquinone oxidoreductase subunit H